MTHRINISVSDHVFEMLEEFNRRHSDTPLNVSGVCTNAIADRIRITDLDIDKEIERKYSCSYYNRGSKTCTHDGNYQKACNTVSCPELSNVEPVKEKTISDSCRACNPACRDDCNDCEDEYASFRKEESSEAVTGAHAANKTITSTCVVCGKQFTAKSSKAQYCSKACNQAAYRERKAKEV